MNSLKIGSRFSSFEKFDIVFKNYQKQNFSLFSITDSKTLDKAKEKLSNPRIKNAPPKLKYYYIKYACVHGGLHKRKETTPIRKSSSMRMNCPALIILKVAKGGKHLVVCNFIETHNHELSSELFTSLPKQRRLDPETQQEIAGLLQIKVDKKLIQKEYSTLTGKNITLRDLSNVRARAKLKTANIEEIIQDLEMSHDCVVKILLDDKKNLQSIYIQDTQMISDFHKYPEILFADWITDIRTPIFVMMVENGNGESVIVAAGVFVTEDQKNYRWFFNTFKELNPASAQIHTVVTDKDSNERRIFKEVFPHVQMKICLFHSLQRFYIEITTQKMGLSSAKVEEIITLLKQLCYTSTSEQYFEIYEKLQSVSPTNVIRYFNENWDNIKDEWTGICKSRYPTFLNRTNNRVENFNSQLMSVLSRFSSLESFFKNFFSVVKCNRERLERAARDAQVFTKKSTKTISPDENNYYKALTPYAYNLVKQQLDEVGTIDRDTLKEYKTDEMYCQCSFAKCVKLPCKHIIAYRVLNKMKIYEEHLIPRRWSRSYFYASVCKQPDESEPSPMIDTGKDP